MIANMRQFPAIPATASRPSIDPELAHVLARRPEDEPTVAVLVLPGMNPFEFAVACEVFGIRRADALATMEEPGWYDLQVCTPDPDAPIDTGLGFRIHAEFGLEALRDADTVIVPMAPKGPDTEAQPCCWKVPSIPGEEVLEGLQAASANGARMVSFCSGAFALAEAGLLDGRRATTHWMYLESFRARYPRVDVVDDVLYVENDGNIFTSAGSASAIDLSLHIVRADHGADVADAVARRMVVPPHRDGGQSQYTRPPEVPRRGAPFAELMDWIVEHVHEPLDAETLAERAAMSPRTFARRWRDATGTTPHQWVTTQRLLRAQQLLETTDLTVAAVASRSGLGSPANLRQRMRDAFGTSPSEYRRRFRRKAS